MKFNFKQFVAITIAVIMVVALLFVNILPPDVRSAVANRSAEAEAGANAVFASYVAEEKQTLPNPIQEQIQIFESSLASSATQEKQEIYRNLMEVSRNENAYLLEADYMWKLAELQNTHEAWAEAGDLHAAMFLRLGEPTQFQELGDRIIAAYEKALAEQTENSDYKVKVAAAYIETNKDVMKGITMLLDVVKAEPDNLKANLILGRNGLISGQFDKAIPRLEKVIEVDPLHAEAYFYLAGAYHQIGEKEKAIALFEKCRELVDDLAFKAEIDQYIKNIKNT